MPAFKFNKEFSAGNLKRGRKARAYLLEEILQRELHDSRIARCDHLTERGTAEIRRGVIHSEAVREIEGLRPEFHFLRFLEPEVSRKGHVELPGAWTSNTAAADVSERAGRCFCKRFGVEIVRDGPVAISATGQSGTLMEHEELSRICVVFDIQGLP